ncbi:hypothetical protein AAMO2058_001684600 [Amorphochlora amoebiformis]
MRPWKLSLWLILTAGSLIFVCKTNVRIVTSSVPKRFVSPGARTTVPHAHLPPRAVSEPIPITAPTDSREASVMGAAIREDFPILSQRIHENKPLIYLDSAATSQKPSRVRLKLREAMKRASTEGVQALKEDYERARGLVADFINAGSSREIVFVRGATEGMNLVARGWGDLHIGEGDEIILSVMEHHSNMVPWQALAERKGARLRFVPLTETQEFDFEAFEKMVIPGKTKIVAMNHVSNVLGCPNPVKQVVSVAHAAGALVSLDACQSVPNMPVDVSELGVDFLAASGHKMLGPTGVGFLWARKELLLDMVPLNYGGYGSESVSIPTSMHGGDEEDDEQAEQANGDDEDPDGAAGLKPVPWRFEAGFGPVAEAIGLGEAVEYLTEIGMENIHKYEQDLGKLLYSLLRDVPGVTLYGPPPETKSGSERGGLVCFNCKGVHSNDLAFFLDQEGVAIRSGHHCTQPLHRALGVAGSARGSMYIYNTPEEVVGFVEALNRTLKLFADLGFGVEDTPPCPLVSTNDPTLRDPGIERPCTELWPKGGTLSGSDSEEEE